MALEHVPGDVYFQKLPHLTLFSRIFESLQEFPWTHCGVIYEEQGWRRWFGVWWGLESFPGIGVWGLPLWLIRLRFFWTPFEVRGFRLDYSHKEEIAETAFDFLDTPHNYSFKWVDGKIHCSELLYEAYCATTGEPLCHLATVGELNYKPYEKEIAKLQGEDSVDLKQFIVTVKDIYENTLP
jgi:hypothetical protein